MYLITGVGDDIETVAACWNISNKHEDLLNGSLPLCNILSTKGTIFAYLVYYQNSFYCNVFGTLRISKTTCSAIYIKHSPVTDRQLIVNFDSTPPVQLNNIVRSKFDVSIEEIPMSTNIHP